MLGALLVVWICTITLHGAVGLPLDEALGAVPVRWEASSEGIDLWRALAPEELDSFFQSYPASLDSPSDAALHGIGVPASYRDVQGAEGDVVVVYYYNIGCECMAFVAGLALLALCALTLCRRAAAPSDAAEGVPAQEARIVRVVEQEEKR